jgi:hypothetical protein
VRLDLHAHSRYSPDSRLDPIEIVKTSRHRGLDGIAITDHNAVEGAAKAWAYGRDVGFTVVRGTEVSTSEGHVLAYGIRDPIPRDLTPRETVERVLALGGVPVAAHPYRFWSGLGEEETALAGFAAYEVRNARTLRRGNEKASALAASKGLAGIGGSDAHFLEEIGRAFTVVEDASTEAEVLEAVRKGRVRGEGIDRGASATLRYVTKCVGQWILRGMHRI